MRWVDTLHIDGHEHRNRVHSETVVIDRGADESRAHFVRVNRKNARKSRIGYIRLRGVPFCRGEEWTPWFVDGTRVFMRFDMDLVVHEARMPTHRMNDIGIFDGVRFRICATDPMRNPRVAAELHDRSVQGRCDMRMPVLGQDAITHGFGQPHVHLRERCNIEPGFDIEAELAAHDRGHLRVWQVHADRTNGVVVDVCDDVVSRIQRIEWIDLTGNEPPGGIEVIAFFGKYRVTNTKGLVDLSSGFCDVTMNVLHLELHRQVNRSVPSLEYQGACQGRIGRKSLRISRLGRGGAYGRGHSLSGEVSTIGGSGLSISRRRSTDKREYFCLAIGS